jgi:hypothetical protein
MYGHSLTVLKTDSRDKSQNAKTQGYSKIENVM